MTFTCPIVAQSHYQGKVHAKNLRMKSVDFKIPGQYELSKFIQSVSLDEFGSVIHYDLFVPWTVASQKTSAPAATLKKMPAEDPGSGMETGGGDGNNSDRFCSICQASFNNPLMAQQHYVGKRHRKQITKQKLMETYGPSSAPGPNTATTPSQSKLKKKVTCRSKICTFCTCRQLPHWRATSALSARSNWTLWNSTSLTSAAPNTRTST